MSWVKATFEYLLFFYEINGSFSPLFFINKVSSSSRGRRIMFRESYVDKCMLLRRLLFPIEFSQLSREAPSSLSPPWPLSPQELQKIKENPQMLPNPRHLTQVSYDCFCSRHKARRQPLGKKAILPLPGDVYM